MFLGSLQVSGLPTSYLFSQVTLPKLLFQPAAIPLSKVRQSRKLTQFTPQKNFLLKCYYIKCYDFNTTKTFLLRWFKMSANQTLCFRIKQRSAIKFWVSEKCKQCELYKRMWDLYGKACFSKKIFTKWLNMGLPGEAWVKKTVHEREKHWLFCKEKVMGAELRKEAHTDSLVVLERIHDDWFLWKKVQL